MQPKKRGKSESAVVGGSVGYRAALRGTGARNARVRSPPLPPGEPRFAAHPRRPSLDCQERTKVQTRESPMGGFGGWRWRGALPVDQGRSPGRVKGNPVTRVACTPFSRTQPLLPWKKEGGSGRGSQSKSLLNKDGRKPCPQGPADPGRPFRADIHVPATVSRDGGDGARGRRWGREGGHPLT